MGGGSAALSPEPRVGEWDRPPVSPRSLRGRWSHLAAEGRATMIWKMLRGTVQRTPRSAEGKGAHRSWGFCVSSSEKRRMGKEVGAIIRIESFLLLCHFSLCLNFSMCERNFSVYVQGPIPSIPTELRHLAGFSNLIRQRT